MFHRRVSFCSQSMGVWSGSGGGSGQRGSLLIQAVARLENVTCRRT